jgi:hypothetical protein
MLSWFKKRKQEKIDRFRQKVISSYLDYERLKRLYNRYSEKDTILYSYGIPMSIYLAAEVKLAKKNLFEAVGRLRKLDPSYSDIFIEQERIM